MYYMSVWASLVAHMVKNPPAMQEFWVRSLMWEDPPEEELATHSGILDSRISWTGRPGVLQFIESQRVGHDWVTELNWTELRASVVAQMVKNLPAMWETKVQLLSWEDILEKGMATHSSVLTWRIPWTEEPGRPQFMGSQRVAHNWVTNTHTSC